MTAVSPLPPDGHLALRPAWIKLDAFDRFRAEATPSWVLSILLLTPIPCFLVNLTIESIPLADPAKGYRDSLHFQLRTNPDNIVEVCPRTQQGYVRMGIANIAAIACGAPVFPVPFTQIVPVGSMGAFGGVSCLHWRVGHLYHVLFTAMCLQIAKSLETLAAGIVVNVCQMLLNYRDILKDAQGQVRASSVQDCGIGRQCICGAEFSPARPATRDSPSEFAASDIFHLKQHCSV
ncbi:hypothetical protein PHYSODRAFT_301838 [Phytophthora sojae]|uniref:Uncharacterized protein n=1 Tax=Phytophthora sojae (strain P6497) TaxID=1094619 RepID=G4ZKA0_PHYSP|nr:hypothetical protein PHYSODRAFT_301838 [Phytophthora sojae]EGZ15217.1 hypothetical protein PHYSODRAFT_301838 [Phytophthora sojae]|eukprot:XP_009528966.1 hypothetical protein PHYSODRAFT_301838 [Phytophthora sojae]